MSWFTRTTTTEKKIVLANPNGSQDDALDWAALGLEVVKVVVTTGISLYLAYQVQKTLSTLVQSFDDGGSKESAENTRKALAKRLKRPDVVEMSFDAYELKLLTEIMGPDEISESFKDIGGMEEQLEEVKDNVVLPMQLWARYRAVGVDAADVDLGLSSCPTGVLLYGLPGTGKSLTAKAIAKGENLMGPTK